MSDPDATTIRETSLVSTPQAWSEAPTVPNDDAGQQHAPCEEPDCANCSVTAQIAEAGARALAREAGIDYDRLDAHARAHYAQIASEVMAAMSETMLALGVAQEVLDDRNTHTQQVGDPS